MLPLLSGVSNAIIDYLKYGRFESLSDHIFLSTRAPNIEVKGQMVSSGINYIISKAGISIKYRHHGPHSMKHSLASAIEFPSHFRDAGSQVYFFNNEVS